MLDDFFWYVWRVIFQSEHLKETSMQFWFKTKVHLDRTACPLVANPEILNIHGWTPDFSCRRNDLIFQSQKRHCLSDDGRDDSRWKISLSEAFGGRGEQLQWRHFYRVLWGGGLWELHGSFWKWKKPLWIYRSSVFFSWEKTLNHRSLIHSSNCYAWKGFAESF